MEYRETFEVKGKYGTHAGPAIGISRIVDGYQEIAKKQGYDLEVEFTKIHCPLGRNIGEKADPFLVVNTLSLFLIESSKIEVVATLDFKMERGEEMLEKCVQQIGNIIQNVDDYTFRKH